MSGQANFPPTVPVPTACGRRRVAITGVLTRLPETVRSELPPGFGVRKLRELAQDGKLHPLMIQRAERFWECDESNLPALGEMLCLVLGLRARTETTLVGYHRGETDLSSAKVADACQPIA